MIVCYDIRDVHEDLIETQPLDLFIPGKSLEVFVQHLRCIAKAVKLFTQNYHDVWADLFGLGNELQLAQATPTRLIITSDNDMFLLDGERQGFQGRVLIFEDGSIEAIVVLSARAMLAWHMKLGQTANHVRNV